MTELSNAFVCIMGIGTVFIGLIAIVFICMIMSAVVKAFTKPEKDCVAPAPAPKAVPSAIDPAEKSMLVAAACACIAEEIGTDASNIKVLSFKRV